MGPTAIIPALQVDRATLSIVLNRIRARLRVQDPPIVGCLIVVVPETAIFIAQVMLIVRSSTAMGVLRVISPVRGVHAVLGCAAKVRPTAKWSAAGAFAAEWIVGRLGLAIR